MTAFTRKSFWIFLLVILTLGTLLIGCSKESAKTGGETKIKEGVTQNDLINFKADPPIEISTAYNYIPAENDFKEGESIEDNVHNRWLEEELGIITKFDFIVNKSEDYDTKLQLALASGGKLPDVFSGGTFTHDFISSGRVQAVDEAIEKYASDNVKALYEEFPDAFNPLKRDGKTYGIPTFAYGDEGSVMWIRKDWLDNLGLEAPKTIDELENVLRAFTEDDPDGNGKDDTFGLATSLQFAIDYTWMANTDGIVGALSDYIPGYWQEDENGKLVQGSIQPSIKTVLALLRGWMEKGYLDPEAGIKDPSKAIEVAVNGTAGVTFGPNWMGQWPLGDASVNDPEIDFQPYPLPAGPDGKIGRAEKSITINNILFSSEFEHLDAWFAYYNKMYGVSFGPDDPYFDPQFEHGYHEGYDWLEFDGKIIKRDFKDKGVPEDQWPKPGGVGEGIEPTFILTGGKAIIPYLGDPGYEKYAESRDAKAANPMEERVSTMNDRQIKAGIVRISQNEHAIFNKFNGAPTKTMETKQELIDKLTVKSFIEIIYGEKPIDYFDEYVKQWKASGGEQITEEINEWYEELKE